MSSRSTLTARPRVPVLVRAAVVGSLAAVPLGCGDDGDSGTSGNSTDVAPTAGPCAHASGVGPECEDTGLDDGVDDGMGTSGTTGMTSTATTPSTTDQAPTAGPCVHADGSQLPECQEDSTTAGSDGASTGSGSDGSGSGSGSGDSGSGTTTTG